MGSFIWLLYLKCFMNSFQNNLLIWKGVSTLSAHSRGSRCSSQLSRSSSEYSGNEYYAAGFSAYSMFRRKPGNDLMTLNCSFRLVPYILCFSQKNVLKFSFIIETKVKGSRMAIIFVFSMNRMFYFSFNFMRCCWVYDSCYKLVYIPF